MAIREKMKPCPFVAVHGYKFGGLVSRMQNHLVLHLGCMQSVPIVSQ